MNSGKVTPDSISFANAGTHNFELHLSGYKFFQEAIAVSGLMSKEIILTPHDNINDPEVKPTPVPYNGKKLSQKMLTLDLVPLSATSSPSQLVKYETKPAGQMTETPETSKPGTSATTTQVYIREHKFEQIYS